MSQATYVYRNKWNGRLGEMTEEQAAIWPDLLERVESESVDEPEVTPLEERDPVIDTDSAIDTDPVVEADVVPEATSPARSNQKD